MSYIYICSIVVYIYLSESQMSRLDSNIRSYVKKMCVLTIKVKKLNLYDIIIFYFPFCYGYYKILSKTTLFKCK